jgi:ABC-2 type transport system ATP-binding protein
MLSLSRVTKWYGDVVALDNVDLKIAPGEVLGLLGPNGAGKTTLVSIAAGLRMPDEGSVRVMGVDVVAAPHVAQRQIGLAPQILGVYMVLSVRQNLRAFGQLRGLGGPALSERIDEVAHSLRLEKLMDRRASTLSGGEQRRLHTAIALLHDPPVVLLDEPTAGADVETRRALLELVRRIASQRGAIVCYSTHYLHEVEVLDGTVALLRYGRIVAHGAVRELVERCGDSFIELRFEGPAPEIDFPLAIRRNGSELFVSTDRPAETAGPLIAALGSEVSRLTSVELHRPSLETVYLALMGEQPVRDETAAS